MDCIGFIGLGNMGLPMAKGLIHKGFNVTGFDLNEAATESLKEAGGKVAQTTTEVLQNSDLLFTSLPSSKAVEDVYLAADGLINNGPFDTILVDTSTVAPDINHKLEEAAIKKGVSYLAAPVSGGVVGAENQTLTFMIGGSKQVYDQIESVLNIMGENIFHVNEQIDSGTTVKLINNLLIGFYTAGVGEALHIANKQGIDLDNLYSMLSVSYGQSRIYERNYKTFISNDDFNPGFALKLLRKDLGFAMDLADQHNLDLPISNDLLSMYEQLEEEGYGDQDMSVVYEKVKKNSEQKGE